MAITVFALGLGVSCAPALRWGLTTERQATSDRVTPEKQAHGAGAKHYNGEKLYERYCALCHGADREGYAADHAPSLRSPELTTEEFLGEMGRSPDLARGHQQLLRAFLEQADLVKFAAHVPSGDDLSAQIQAAEAFLEETREPGSSMEASDG